MKVSELIKKLEECDLFKEINIEIHGQSAHDVRIIEDSTTVTLLEDDE